MDLKDYIKESDLPQAVSESSDIHVEELTNKEQYATSPSKSIAKKQFSPNGGLKQSPEEDLNDDFPDELEPESLEKLDHTPSKRKNTEELAPDNLLEPPVAEQSKPKSHYDPLE